MPVPEQPNSVKRPVQAGEQIPLEELASFQQDEVDQRVVQEVLTQHHLWSSEKLKAAMVYLNKGVAPVFSMMRHYSFVHKDQQLNATGWYEVYDCALNFCVHNEKVFLGGSVRLDGLQLPEGIKDRVLSLEDINVLDEEVMFPYAPTLYIPPRTSVVLPKQYFKKRVLLFSLKYNHFFNAPEIDWKHREKVPYCWTKKIRCASEKEYFTCSVMLQRKNGTKITNHGSVMAHVHLSRRK